jgi:hypothetical protein
MQSSSNDRRAFLRKLDAIEHFFATGGRLISGLVIAAVLAAAAYVFVKRPLGAGHQGEYFYFSVVVLLVLGWAVGQYLSFNQRLQRLKGETVEEPMPNLGLLQALLPGGAQTTFAFSGTLPPETIPTDEALTRFQTEIEHGTPIDEACSKLQPQYGGWNIQERCAYQLLLEGLLNERRKAS